MADVDISDLPVPPTTADDTDISDLPVPPSSSDPQTLGGFGQAAGTILPRALTDLAGLPVDTATNVYNLEQAGRGAIKGSIAEHSQSLPEGETLASDGRSGVTPKGLHHFIAEPDLDEEGNPVGPPVETYSKEPPLASLTAHPAYKPKPVDEFPATRDTPVPGSSEWAKDQIRQLGGSGLIDAKERTAINRYTQAIGEGAAFGAVGGGGGIANTLKAMAAGGAAGGAQQGAADAGFSPGAQASIGFIAGAAAGARGRNPEGGFKASPGDDSGKTINVGGSGASPAETILDTPDVQHEGAGAEIAPTPGSKVVPPTPKAAPEPPVKGPPEASEAAVAEPEPQPEASAAETPESETGVTAEPVKIQHKPEPPASNHPMQNGKPYTMITGELPGQDPRMNVNRSTAMENLIQSTGLPYARTRGSFQGSQERSFAVQTPNDAARAKVEALAGKFNQPSVIHVDETGQANYKDLGNEQKSGPIGQMQKVPQAEAEAAQGWTRDKQGNYYTIKAPTAAEAIPPIKNGVGVDPPATMPSMFEGAAQDGIAAKAKSPAEQAQRVETFKRIGLSEVRNSAITGDSRQAGTEFQTSKLKDNEAGDRLANLIDTEREAVRQHAQSLVKDSGGSAGLNQPDLYARGQKMEAPIQAWHQHLDGEMQQAYDVARVRAADKPFKLDQLGDILKNEKSEFLSTVEGKQLHEGVTARLGELGLAGPNETFNPATVDQAERLRQYLGDAWSPRTARLIGQLKSRLDQDVMTSAGTDLFERGRNLRTLISKTLEEPDAVSALMRTKEANKLGVNRTVAQEDVPSFITKQPVDQFKHYVSTLKQIAGSGVPALRSKAVKALDETRAQFANEYVAAGDNLKGMWNQKAANKYLRENETAMRHIFTPEEMQKFQDNDNAGRWLSMDRTYPGAAAQKQNILAKGAKHAGTAAEVAGAHAYGIPGLIAGKAVGKMGDRFAGWMTKAGAEKLVTPLNTWKPGSTKAGAAP